MSTARGGRGVETRHLDLKGSHSHLETWTVCQLPPTSTQAFRPCLMLAAVRDSHRGGLTGGQAAKGPGKASLVLSWIVQKVWCFQRETEPYQDGFPQRSVLSYRP